MLTDLVKKVFENDEVVDQPFPEVVPHTHNSVDSPALAPGSVSSVTIQPDAVNESKIVDLSITQQKLADLSVATQKIKDDAITAAKVWKGGAVITLSAQIEEAVIKTAHIQDLAIVWAKIGSMSVGNSKMMDAAISTAKIQDLAVTNTQIADATITNGKIGTLQVGNSRIMEAAISTSKIQNLAVTSAQIADATITNGKIGTLEVGNSRIMNSAISSAKIQDLAVNDAHINDINAGKITAGYMSADHIYSGQGYFDAVHIMMCGLQALNVAGNINKTGTCNFAIPHPLKPGQQLVYTGIESAEVLLVERGSDQLEKGEKTIRFSDHYKAMSDPQKVTAHITPKEDCKGLYVAEATNDHITVKEAGNGKSGAKFDYIIFTVRTGFFNFDFEPENEAIIQEKNETEENFKGRFFDHRIKLIRKYGGENAEQKVQEFTEKWNQKYGTKKGDQSV